MIDEIANTIYELSRLNPDEEDPVRALYGLNREVSMAVGEIMKKIREGQKNER